MLSEGDRATDLQRLQDLVFGANEADNGVDFHATQAFERAHIPPDLALDTSPSHA